MLDLQGLLRHKWPPIPEEKHNVDVYASVNLF